MRGRGAWRPKDDADAVPASTPAEPAWRIELRSPRVPAGNGRRALVVGTWPGNGTGNGNGEQPFAPHDATVVHAGDGALMERLRAQAPDDVYFDLSSGVTAEVLADVGARLLMDGVAIHLLLRPAGAPPVRLVSRRQGPHDVVSLEAVQDGPAGRVVRRLVDVLGAGVLLVVCLPLLAAVALVVAIAMGRPVLHGHRRLGRGGRIFRCYKFRSMVRDAEERLRRDPELHRLYVASNFKLPEDRDPRITRLGRLLRRTSLDELPQLWNVLRGDMTFVGPRPIVPDELARYGDYGGMLLRVKPGITGLWQVSGRSDVGYPERARLDLDYLATRSIGRDLELMLRTVPAVLRRRGAV